jgi:hypothetical protein
LPDKAVLVEHVTEIRKLGKRVTTDVIEIGWRLAECRALVDHGEWRVWLKREFGWSPQTAGRFIQVYELVSKHSNLEHLEVPVSGLYLLAAPSTPEKARDTVIERAQAGPVSLAETKQIIADTDGRKQAAKKKAREHTPVDGSNYVDPSASAEAMKAKHVALEEQEQPDEAEEHWQRAVSNLAGDCIAMQALWSREFPGWGMFEVPSHIATLIEQAADAWNELANTLVARVGKNQPDTVPVLGDDLRNGDSAAASRRDSVNAKFKKQIEQEVKDVDQGGKQTHFGFMNQAFGAGTNADGLDISECLHWVAP